MRELSKTDKLLIECDRFAREYETSLCSNPPVSETRSNEYIDFLTKCSNHAIKVSDYAISRKIRDEIGAWNEVYPSEPNS